VIEVNEFVESDVLIIGGGIAGSMAGIAAKEALGDSGKVVVVSKGRVGRSGQSPFAAGIFAVFDPALDDMDVWLEEAVELGEYLNDQEWCKLLFQKMLPVAQLIDGWGQDYGVKLFERDADGRFLRRRSRGHIRTWHNLVNALPLMDTLRRKQKAEGVVVLDRVMITDLISSESRIIGALGLNLRKHTTILLTFKSVVLAASGSTFKSVFIGHKDLTGDIQVAAFDAGVIMRNLEQYATNTCARDFDIHGMNLYTSVGGKFLNGQGEEFMWKYNPVLGNRARLQDLVMAFCREVQEGRGPVFLDVSAASPEGRQLCRKILPESFMAWDRAGIDPFQQRVEWIPAFVGTTVSGGGIHANTCCETNLPHVFAAGDITPNPPSGTQSFGGLALSYSGISGREAGFNAAADAKTVALPVWGKRERARVKGVLKERLSPLGRLTGILPDEAYPHIQKSLIPSRVGYLKSRPALEESLDAIQQVQADMLPRLCAPDAHELGKAIEVQNMMKMAHLMILSSLAREESRGFHFREDFPVTDNENWLKWIMVKKEGEEIKVWPQEYTLPYVRPKEKRQAPPGVRRA